MSVCRVYNINVIPILVCFLWVHVTLVACTNGSQYSINEPMIEKMKLLDRPHDKNGYNVSRLHIPVQFLRYSAKKVNGTEEKARTKNSQNKKGKGAKTKNTTLKKTTSKIVNSNKTISKVTSSGNFTLKEKSLKVNNLTKNLNSTKNATTKRNLRKGNQDKEKWPKLQKSFLRDEGSTTDTKRITKLNMMQLDDDEGTTFPTLPPISKLSLQEEQMNEVFNQYSIKDQMRRIGARFPEINVTVQVVGRTLEYNDIVLVKLSQKNEENPNFRADDNKYVDDTNEKKVLFIVHALSVMGMLYLDCLVEERKFVQLLSYYIEHLDKFDIFLIPLANPDGYGVNAYQDENWNKNLSPQDGCPGVALDRNFDVQWNTSRKISSCSQMYPGPAPFSEPETKVIRNIFHRYSQKIIAYIHVHSGTYTPEVFKGDAVLYPKGYTDVQSDDDKYIDLKGEIDDAMRKANFQVYSVAVDTLYNWYGKVTGASVDYAATVYGIPYAMEFVMQLYHDESWGELPSAEQTSHHVLIEVWRRIIDVVANNIHNSMKSNEV